MSRGCLLVLLVVCSATFALASSFDEADEGNIAVRETRKERLCGRRLFQAIYAVCTREMGRKRRNAIPDQVYPGNLSPFLMSIYRPSIDEDMTITDGNWEVESPSRNRFERVALLRRLNKRSAMAPEGGASDRCCRKACSWQELREFCF